MIERLYEEVLEEGAIMDWLKDPKSRPMVKKLANELGSLGLIFTSVPVMGVYVGEFLQKNFPNLPEQAIQKIAQFIANNPQVLDFLKG
jgi:hypothetical protein